jgi:hypothetical protein
MLPEKVNIFGIEYTIRLDKDEYLDASSSLGEINYTNQEIYIKNSMSEERKVKILVHEICHGLIFEAGATSEAGNEKMVGFMGICLHHFLTKNDLKWVK